jgi:hypothetical protein
MSRPVNSATRIYRDQYVTISYEQSCDGKAEDEPEKYMMSGLCSCMPCEHRRIFDKLRPTLTSHFTRDKDIRDEFLRAYFGLVQTRWARRGSERGTVHVQALPELLHTFSELAKQLKHLTLNIEWRHTGLTAPAPSYFSQEWENDDAFRSNALQMGMLFAIMH